MFLQSLLSPRAAAPAAAPAPVVAAAPGATPAAAPATSAAAVGAAGEPQPVPAASAQPVEDAGIAATLLGKVGMSQNRFLANQQMLGMISAQLGARLSNTFSNVVRMLKGEPTPQAGSVD